MAIQPSLVGSLPGHMMYNRPGDAPAMGINPATTFGDGGLPPFSPPAGSNMMGNTPGGAPAPNSGNIGSFLTEGNRIPQGSALKATQSQSVLPEWYTNYAMELLSNQQAVAQRPFQLAPMPRVAEFSPAQQQGFGMAGQAAGAYQPALAQATQATQGALGAPGALATAQPFLNQAGQTSVANIGQYMNPYQGQVIDRIGQLGARNLSENILPEIEGRYIANGQLGFGGRQPGMGTPSGMMTDTARAVRGTQEAVLAEQAKALQQGYTDATGLASADLARFAGLGATAGGLSRADTEQQFSGAKQLADMGGDAQRLGLLGAGALQQVGGAQQDQAQSNLDAAYKDFLLQQGYPQEQINNMMTTFRGVQPGVPAGSQEFGIVPLGFQEQLRPSTGESIGSFLAAVAGTLAK